MDSPLYYLFMLAVILLSTKLFGLFTEKIHMPQVVGALCVGILFGPSGLGILPATDFIEKLAEIGVIMLMFDAGLSTDLEEMKHTGVASFVVAAIGVIVPLVGGYFVYSIFYGDAGGEFLFLKKVFVGVVLTATSVSITVETLKEMGMLKGRIGSTILGAAIIDDILGIIVLTIVTAATDPTINPAIVLVKIGLFFLFIIIAGFCAHAGFRIMERAYGKKRRVAIYGLSFCFLLAFISQEVFGVADITGAYFAGLILCSLTKARDYIDRKVSISSYMLFSPVFFASIGMKTSLNGMTGKLLAFSVVLLAVAILTKVIGCGLGALILKYTKHEALSIGVGMISRGEVALIVAQKGVEANLVSEQIFPAVVLVVIVTTLITPLLLKIVLAKDVKQAQGA